MWSDDTAATAALLRAVRGAAEAGDQWAAWAMAVSCPTILLHILPSPPRCVSTLPFCANEGGVVVRLLLHRAVADRSAAVLARHW
jgi:hypothetical protein